MENFEYESCREFRILHFSFQAPIRLRLKSTVNLKSRQKYVIRRFEFEINFSSTFVWKLENIRTWKLFHIENATTLVLGKISFELWFKNYFLITFGKIWIYSTFHVTSFNWNLILHAKFLTPPIEDIDAFYFSFHGEYEELHYYPKSDVSHPKYKHIHTHTHALQP